MALGQRRTQAIQPAQFLAHHAGTTAQHLRRLEATRRGDVGTGTVQRRIQAQALALVHAEAAPGLERLAVEPCVQVGTGQGQAAVLLGNQAEATEGDLDHGGPRPIAQQPVGPAHRHPVQRPALGHAQMAHAKTSGILQQAQRCTGLNRQAAHAKASSGVSSPPKLMKVA
ncbi:hypothetical protein D3C79_727780 [compost metagenome]